MADLGSASRKTNCPCCGYSLRGLPSVYTCPECGSEYDPHSMVLPLPGNGKVLAGLVSWFCLAATIVWILRAQHGHLVEPWPCMLPVALLVAVALYQWLTGAAKERRFIINGAGIKLRHPEVFCPIITWEQFGEAHVSWVTGRFGILGVHGETLFGCQYRELGSLFRMSSYVEQLNAVAALYKKEQLERPRVMDGEQDRAGPQGTDSEPPLISPH